MNTADPPITDQDKRFIRQHGLFCWLHAVRLKPIKTPDKLGPDLGYAEPERPAAPKDKMEMPFGFGEYANGISHED